MGGVTPHGIRYPDGASKAKNLGPELKTMAEDIDDVFTDTTTSGVWRGIVEEIAEDVVQDEVADLNIVQAYPETPVTQTTLGAIPLRWVHKNLSAGYPSTYPTAYPGVWVGTNRRRGDVPILSTSGTLRDSQIPGSIARLSDIPDVGDIPDITDVLDEIRDAVSQMPVNERRVSPELPVFAGRVAAASTVLAPVAVGFVGSSTTARSPGYVERLAKVIQATYPTGVATPVQWSAAADFVEETGPGIHVYNAAKGGTRAVDYLPSSVASGLSALDLSMLVHMVGANDYLDSVPVATYKSRVLGRLELLDATLPYCQHVLVQPYPRRGGWQSGQFEFPWADYGAALKEIAESRANTVYLDISGAYAAVGVAEGNSPDPLGMIDSDDVHQTDAGNRFMADLLSALIAI